MNEDNKNKQIAYSDYLLLKNSFNELLEKYNKLKDENKELNNILKETQSSIKEFEKSKNNISQLVIEVQEKYNNLQRTNRNNKK